MTNPVLLIYDNSGTVWGIHGGQAVVPEGIQGIVTEFPNYRYKTVSVNVVTKEPIWEIAADVDSQITNLQEAIIGLEERVAELEAK